MKTAGVTSAAAISTSLPCDTGNSGNAGAFSATLIHQDTARHGIDAAAFIGQMRSSPTVSAFATSRQHGGAVLQTSFARQFGTALTGPLFNDRLQLPSANLRASD